MENFRKQRNYDDIIIDCHKNKDNNQVFDKYFRELLSTDEIKNMQNAMPKRSMIQLLIQLEPALSYEVINENILVALSEILNTTEISDIRLLFKAVLYKTRDLLVNVELSEKAKREYYELKNNSKSNNSESDNNEHQSVKKKNNTIKIVYGDDKKGNSEESSETYFDDKSLSDPDPKKNYKKKLKEQYTNIMIAQAVRLRKELEEVLEQRQGDKYYNDKDWLIYVMMCTCFGFHRYKYDGWQSLMTKLCEISSNKEISEGMNKLCVVDSLDDWDAAKISKKTITEEQRKYVENIVKYCKNYGTPFIQDLIRERFTFSAYVELVHYFIKMSKSDSENGKLKAKKLSIQELIVDFNKIRNYMSVLLNSDKNDKASFLREYDLGESSYDKERSRVLSLFRKSDSKAFKEDVKKYSPNELSKIYEIHNVPNLIPNLLIADILRKQDKPVKLVNLMEELFRDSKYESCDKNKKDNFRKNTLIPRLNELEEYGIVKKTGNDRYSLTEKKPLTDEQKEALKYVVPFFCGRYPFASIGHFLANRLDIKNMFEFEAFNLANTLDDCITFDLLSAINNKEKITLNFRDKEKEDVEITPKELVSDKDNDFLKVVSDEGTYYLYEIDEINNDKPKNLIFSEIYSFYYKIFEKAVGEYKQKQICDIDSIIKDYGSMETPCKNNADKIREIYPMLANLDNVELPLTRLELQWLKTIMCDDWFDLFVSEREKQTLEELVEDIEPFDLSKYKIYDNKSKKYKTILKAGVQDGLDRDTLRKSLREWNTSLFNVRGNYFPKLTETNSV